MKHFKRFTSAVLTIAVIAGAGHAANFRQSSAQVSGETVMYSSVIDNWEQLIAEEKQKFPDRSYWNHKGISSDQWSDDCCSSTPCRHTPEKALGVSDDSETYIKASIRSTWEEDYSQTIKEAYDGQCNGFARKLATDIWKTDDFVRYYSTEGEYEPQIGDVVRLSFPVLNMMNENKYVGHSIFITGISDDHITYAECNGDMEHCQIFWDCFYYYSEFYRHFEQWPDAQGNNVELSVYEGEHKVKVTKEYINEHLSYYERPHVKGDFDLNGKIDSGDVEHFKNSYLDRGEIYYRTEGNAKRYIEDEAYDINNDGRVSEADYSYIQSYASLPYTQGCLYGTGNNVYEHDRFRLIGDDYFVYNSGIYRPLDNYSATFVGPFYTYEDCFTVASEVYDGSRKKYTVTAIGDITDRPSGKYIPYIQSITIPETVTTIKQYAFSNSDSDLRSISFSGNDPQLTTIEKGAFYNCPKIYWIDLRKCRNLRSIEDDAFYGCDSLIYVDLPYTTHTLTLGSSANGSIFKYNKSNTTTLYINNPNTSSYSYNYQILNIAGGDHTLWKNGMIRMHGRLFKVYDQGNYVCQKDSSIGYLYCP
ncbi:MAG: leucine-rich repeat protein [Ruminococcus sp.]|uniref:leucine-rich repeat protein n=1 Tax=Ruminococcus sp. TaxID=41978 RepID=UPI001B27D5E4|nr:leucine-rich repeat protein [Ruminococcus sp.]MBO7472998.1 leucine-rich repeat protein [Ruminococcus sp.]MBP5431680.1 leucine-rich repeat protein [Ruminococcus sp.]